MFYWNENWNTLFPSYTVFWGNAQQGLTVSKNREGTCVIRDANNDVIPGATEEMIPQIIADTYAAFDAMMDTIDTDRVVEAQFHWECINKLIDSMIM